MSLQEEIVIYFQFIFTRKRKKKMKKSPRIFCENSSRNSDHTGWREASDNLRKRCLIQIKWKGKLSFFAPEQWTTNDVREIIGGTLSKLLVSEKDLVTNFRSDFEY